MIRERILSLLSLAAALTLTPCLAAESPLRLLATPAQTQPGSFGVSPMLLQTSNAFKTLQVRTSAGTTAAPTLPATYYGMHVLHLPYGTAWPVVSFGTWRLWDASVDWAQLQPKAGTYNWTILDTYVALAQQKHIDLILELGQTPQWASSAPGGASAGATAPPTSNALWTAYVTAVATRYKGKIAYYEIWNEANSPNYWTGSPAQLVQLTALAFKAIKTIDPAARVISPSIANASPTSVAYLKYLLDLGMGSSIDVIGIHFYELGKTPEALVTDAKSVQALLLQENLSGKPIFNTEFGWAAPNIFNSVDDQSAYLMRSLLVGWGAGMERFVWYAWDNSNWVTVAMTLPDFKTPTMVVKAYTTLQQWTSGKQVSRCAVTTGTIWACDITDLSGNRSRIYWNTAGTVQVTPSLTWKPVHAVDMYGNVTAYSGGALTISARPLLITE